MESFYRHLRAGSSTTQSLRLAQAELRASAAWKDPFYWAGFFLAGSPVTFSAAAEK
jgi:CHAT domain-containing protein